MGPLAALLLERGHTILGLVRGKGDEKPEERLRAILGDNQRLFAIPGDVTQTLAGVSDKHLHLWRGKIDLVIHGAASTKFDETPNAKIRITNVWGTKQMLKLAEELGILEFHHMSTIYVAGDSREFNEQDLYKDQYWRNVYEISKYEAELAVRYWPYGSFSMYRLPIVVGDSRTGTISSFTGYYGFLEPLWRLKKTILERWKKDRETLQQEGVIVEDDIVSLPISIPCEGPINLAPMDWLVKTMADLVEIPAQGKTFHLSNPQPPDVREAMSLSLESLGFRGVICESRRTIGIEDSPSLSRIQKIIERGIEPYLPYISQERQRFGHTIIASTLHERGKDYSLPPAIDRELISRLLGYAMAREFGRNRSGEKALVP